MAHLKFKFFFNVREKRQHIRRKAIRGISALKLLKQHIFTYKSRPEAAASGRELIL